LFDVTGGLAVGLLRATLAVFLDCAIRLALGQEVKLAEGQLLLAQLDPVLVREAVLVDRCGRGYRGAGAGFFIGIAAARLIEELNR